MDITDFFLVISTKTNISRHLDQSLNGKYCTAYFCIYFLEKLIERILINFNAKQNTIIMYLPQYEICLTIF